MNRCSVPETRWKNSTASILPAHEEEFREDIRKAYSCSDQMKATLPGDINRFAQREVKDFFNNIPKTACPTSMQRVEVATTDH